MAAVTGPNSEGSEIAEFYDSRCVLITGATGFMGKVLVEKLLRSCPGIQTIFLLMRAKSGADVRTRLHDLVSAKLFDRIRGEYPGILSKLVPVNGDITQPGLGLSPEDEQMLIDRVSVVFHAAATVKFDEALKMSVNMNVHGTKRLVSLCHKMNKLACLVHVSTAYCNCDREEVLETVYPPPMEPNHLIPAMEWMDEALIRDITPRLVGNRPNTYTYTKALAEHSLITECGNLPTAIVRPSIVTAAWREPVPGWVDNLNGPTGLLVGAGKGVLRTILCYREKRADLVPVDIPINLMIAVAWYTATRRPGKVLVFNCTSGEFNPIRWGDIETWGHTIIHKYPFNDVLWYPSGAFKTSKTLNNIYGYFLHYLPAYVLDGIALVSGKKPVMLRIQRKMTRAMDALEYFTTREWLFKSENVPMLLQQLNPVDRDRFNFDIRGLNWYLYLQSYILGTRQFVLKEDLSSLPRARRHLRKLYWLRILVHTVLVMVVLRFLLMRSDTVRHMILKSIHSQPQADPKTTPIVTLFDY
ncbi:unnamed protein product [Darwinula stevensoni]|uniref:Fatty acyl-CoA reductase n=1 Tax=Darwinula stevensoni TaxID=69355 RepID=A0A7R8ZYC5_9CRUS|nr:unnamed protein product [Darwinula stevensoni]CAG0880196.1 unnamed protein product [Darwinula stevensoni]